MSIQRLSELPVGVPIPFDIAGADGNVRIRRGSVLSEREIHEILSKGLFGSAVKEPKSSEGDSSSTHSELSPSQIHHYYGERLFGRINNSIDHAKNALQLVVEQSNHQRPITGQHLHEIVGEIVDEIIEDVSAVLAAWSELTEGIDSSNSESHLLRSIQLATLSSTIACSMGLSIQECKIVGLAGMLHDLSLMGSQIPNGNVSDERNQYLLHPTRSTALLASSSSIPMVVRVIVSQVHELPDGTGFPRKLKGYQLNPLSQILSLADAYIALTQPFGNRQPVFPSDAMAYLIHQTIHGKFSRDCMKCLLSVASIYPIGSSIRLDDERAATVIRSNETNVSRPIVILNSPPFALLDLDQSDLGIVGPLQDSRTYCRRLRTSELKKVLWNAPVL